MRRELQKSELALAVFFEELKNSTEDSFARNQNLVARLSSRGNFASLFGSQLFPLDDVNLYPGAECDENCMPIQEPRSIKSN